MKLPRGIRLRGNALLVDVTVKGERRTTTVQIIDGDLSAALDKAVREQARLRAELLGAVNGNGKGHQAGSWPIQHALNVTTQVAWSDPHVASREHLIANAAQVVEYFGSSTLLSNISIEQIDAYVEHLRKEEGNSNGTINRKLAALSKMMSVALRRGGLSLRPHIPRQKETKGRIRWLTKQEEDTCLAWLAQHGKDEEAEVFSILVDTGLRPSELYRLEARDCLFEIKRIQVWETKNDESRSVPMVSRTSGILQRRADLTPTGKLYDYDAFWFNRTWKKMRVALGMSRDRDFVPYALRHTCASRLAQRGVHMRTIQLWLGHKTIQITERYVKMAGGDLDQAAAVLEAI